jgi:hypothetical protein
MRPFRQTPPLPAMLPMPPSNHARGKLSPLLKLAAGYVDSHTVVSLAEFFTPDVNAHETQHDTDFHPYLLTDE